MLVAVFAATLMVVATVVHGTSPLPRCPVLADVNDIAMTYFYESSYSYKTTKEYFCSSDVPAVRHCKCGASETCHKALSPIGDVNIGVCGCCAVWVIVLLVLIAAVLVASLCVGIYYFLCQNRWWCDGAPKPHPYCIPKSAGPVIVPAAMRFPPTLFRGYNAANFVNDDETAAGAAAPATAEPSLPVSRAVSRPATSVSSASRSRWPTNSTVFNDSNHDNNEVSHSRVGDSDEDVMTVVRPVRRTSTSVVSTDLVDTQSTSRRRHRSLTRPSSTTTTATTPPPPPSTAAAAAPVTVPPTPEASDNEEVAVDAESLARPHIATALGLPPRAPPVSARSPRDASLTPVGSHEFDAAGSSDDVSSTTRFRRQVPSARRERSSSGDFSETRRLPIQTRLSENAIELPDNASGNEL